MIINMIAAGRGGDPEIDVKSSYVTASRTNTSTMSFSGLSVENGETLVGLNIVYTGTLGTNAGDVNSMVVLQDGTGWRAWKAMANQGAVVMTSSLLSSFVKTGETGGTITLDSGFSFLSGTYNITPIVAALR